jgi:transposase
MSRPFSIAVKQQMIARLTGVNAVSAAQLARETGITQQNLSRWLSEARNRPLGPPPGDGTVSTWTVEQKARILAQAATLTGDELTGYLAGEGVRLAHFRRWRLALEEAGEVSVGMAKRIGRLERELSRKERALAEAAALLVLRESIESLSRNEEDNIDEQIDEDKEPDLSQSIMCDEI